MVQSIFLVRNSHSSQFDDGNSKTPCSTTTMAVEGKINIEGFMMMGAHTLKNWDEKKRRQERFVKMSAEIFILCAQARCYLFFAKAQKPCWLLDLPLSTAWCIGVPRFTKTEQIAIWLQWPPSSLTTNNIACLKMLTMWWWLGEGGT